MSRRGICNTWFRGRHISPSMPYREARSVAEISEGPTASKSDRTGRNPVMTRLIRRPSSTSGCTAFFLSFKYSVSAYPNVLALPYVAILVTRAPDLMSAHNPGLWEILCKRTCTVEFLSPTIGYVNLTAPVLCSW